MSEISRHTPLKECVAFFLDINSKSDRERDKAWLTAFRGYRVMGFAATWEPKTLRLPVNGNMTVTLPPDFISWTKIGVLNASNEISTLKINRSLTKYKDTNPNRQDHLNPDVPTTNFWNIALNPFYLNYYFGNWYTPLYGLGNGLVQFSDIVVDEKNNVIVLGPSYPFNDIMLEYISSPEKDDDYMIETCLAEAVMAFIEWKFKLGTEQNFYARFKEGRRSLPGKRFTLQEANQAIRENAGYKLKS